MQVDNVIILDFGSQYTQLIARRIRELKIYSKILPCYVEIQRIKEMQPKAIILSGGPSSVYHKKSHQSTKELYDLNIPILGVCYGFHLIAKDFGGEIIPTKNREYGRAMLKVKKQSRLLDKVSNSFVWMSHGDSVVNLPKNFIETAYTENARFCVIENSQRDIYGLQFHPEVHHTQMGKTILSNFLLKIAKIHQNWNPETFIEESSEMISKRIGDKKAICAISGGVDSLVASLLVSRVIGEKLTCVFVDNGFLRKNEAKEVKSALKNLGLKIKTVNASKLFYKRLDSVTKPESKRKIIGKTFIEVFEKEVNDQHFLVQGTLYPDVIESTSSTGLSKTIKTHHNVGGLPKRMKLKLVEPLRELFKDEVRVIGKKLGAPKDLLSRHPFPGPGLAVRILGKVTKEKLKILREADAIFINELKQYNLYETVWQAFAVLLPVQSVGVMGDNRSYEQLIVLRSVNSVDGMTADWSVLPQDFLREISSKIINQVKGVNRVVYDISSKPPATIEWE